MTSDETETEIFSTIEHLVDLSLTSTQKIDGIQKDNDWSKSTSSKTYTNEDLIELVRAVKFSNPNASIRAVHNEITTKMALTESFEFLRAVKLNDVKKVWKKAMSGNSKAAVDGQNHDDDPSSTKSKCAADSTHNEKSSSVDTEKILKFYTVGDGSVQMLARKYTLREAALAAAATRSQEREQELKKYVHCFLDVPADRSGKKPHQALINFNGNNHNGSDILRELHNLNGGGDVREIVKIQVAAPLPGVDIKTPMLLYNADRSAMTFIHPDDDDETGYNRISDLIKKKGVRGAVRAGGMKSFFFARITRRQEGEGVISIDVTSGLAPMQGW